MGDRISKNGETIFDWRVYADATCAGLSVLFPIPLVDMVFEGVFRRRMPGTIGRTRGVEIDLLTRRRLGRGEGWSLSPGGCLVVPISVIRYVLRRAWRKVIYVLAIADSATALSEYWHRAFLLDHMVRAGHLDPGADKELAARVFNEVLEQIDTSPLMGLARQTAVNARQVFRILVRARRLGAAEVSRSFGEVLASHYTAAEASFSHAASAYNERYRSEVAARESNEPEVETQGGTESNGA